MKGRLKSYAVSCKDTLSNKTHEVFIYEPKKSIALGTGFSLILEYTLDLKEHGLQVGFDYQSLVANEVEFCETCLRKGNRVIGAPFTICNDTNRIVHWYPQIIEKFKKRQLYVDYQTAD